MKARAEDTYIYISLRGEMKHFAAEHAIPLPCAGNDFTAEIALHTPTQSSQTVFVRAFPAPSKVLSTHVMRCSHVSYDT